MKSTMAVLLWVAKGCGLMASGGQILVPPVSLLINKLRVKQTKKAAQVTLSAFCKKLGKPCAV